MLRAEGGLLAQAVRDPDPDAGTPHAEAAGRWAFVVEAVFEGHLLHHGTSRIVAQDDPDLALLAGDRLYALGLERLAAAGDLEAVRALARTIAAGAAAAAAGDREREGVVWRTGAAAVGRSAAAAE